MHAHGPRTDRICICILIDSRPHTMVRPAKSSSALPRREQTSINPANKMASARKPKCGVIDTTKGSDSARLRSCFDKEISHLPQENIDHLHTYIPNTTASPQTDPTEELISNPAAAPSLSHNREHGVARDILTMDMAPDHFDFTDPQPESSSTAAARAHGVANPNQSPPEHSSSSPGPHPPHTMTGALDVEYSSESDTAVTTKSGPISGADTPPTSADERQEESGSYDIRYKSKPAGLALCTWHEVCWQTQYTRPAIELFQEILEVRYPVRSGRVSYWHRLLAGLGLRRQASTGTTSGESGSLVETAPLLASETDGR